MRFRLSARSGPSLVLAVGLLCTCPSASPQRADRNDFTRTYSGTIGGFPIRMTLHRRGNALSGNYTYTRKGITLTVRGTLHPSSAGESGIAGSDMELVEYDPKGRRSGRFDGQFTSSAMARGSWWKTERPGRRLSFTLRSAERLRGRYAGSWTVVNPAITFSLDLAERAGRLDGSYCAVTENATHVDCPSPVTGTVTGGGNVRLHWTSAFGGGSGTAVISRQGSRLRWRVTGSPSTEFFAPRDVMMRRSKG